jgi:hypothetical protein
MKVEFPRLSLEIVYHKKEMGIRAPSPNKKNKPVLAIFAL